MSANGNDLTRSRQRQWGGVLLLGSAITGTVMLFLAWFLIPYTADSRVGHVRIATYPIKLIDILLHTVSVPAGVSQSYIPGDLVGEIYLFIAGILFWGICAIIALRTTRSLRWLFGVGAGYVILIGLLLLTQQMWMGLSALSDPYVSIKAANFQWLLLLFCGGIFSGSYLIANASLRLRHGKQ